MAGKVIKIGGASGFWGESPVSVPQLLKADLDYIVFDYLAEITMSIMARARAADPQMGYAVDFVTAVMRPHLKTIAERKIKVVSNAGGTNPKACADAVRALVAEAGLDLTVACVTGDDLVARKDELGSKGFGEMFSGDQFPDAEKIASINAYLGGFPIAAALTKGADIVITGRCVDSAVTLGACIAEFGWGPNDLDQLAGGSLAGHIIECGPQCTGGNFTDWAEVIETIHEIGYPIAEIAEDGSFVTTKPEGTGGMVTVGTVAEQMVYEIGDPQAYMLPDVVCDFSAVEITQEGRDRVLVKGAKGHPAPSTYKVSMTYQDGFRAGAAMGFYGIDADKKARLYAQAVLKRTRERLRASNLGDFTETDIEIIGAEAQYGDYSEILGAREVMMKLAVKHPDVKGVGLLLKEVVGMALATPPGLSIFGGNRPKPSPVVRLFSFLIPKTDVPVTIDLGAGEETVAVPAGQPFDPATLERPAAPAEPGVTADMIEVPLVRLAWGRSGDKGDKANVGIIARDPAYLPYIWASIDESVVKARFRHFLKGEVERFALPGSNAINFLLHDVLGGGGVASLRNDPQGKGYAQLLLEAPVHIPRSLLERAA